MERTEMTRPRQLIRKFAGAALLALGLLVAMPLTTATVHAQAAAQADPTGATTGKASDVTVKDAAAPTLAEVMETVGHNKIAINFVWTLICGFIVMFMQAGFAIVETGFTRAKNAAHTMSMNFMVYALGMLGYWVSGFALHMGGVGNLAVLGGTPPLTHEFTVTLAGHTMGLFGTQGFFLAGGFYDVGVFALFLFQMVFMDTAATIPTGVMAERWKFSSFCIFAFLMGGFVYPIYANWVWGGGWLATLGSNFGIGHGHVDFAGSSVVHLVGGVAGLAGGIVLGPRLGKYNKNGTANVIAPHHLPMGFLGTFILAFGWFGFNPGSTLAGGDLRIAVVATNTMLASAGGALSAMLYMWIVYGKPDPGMMINGMLAGLVAITAPCAFVNAPVSVLIGLISGVLVIWAALFIEKTLKIDDPVGAIAVHGVNGAWGIVALGLFADGSYGDGWNGVPGTVKGLFYGDASQLVAELIGIAACFVWVFVTFFIFFKIIDAVVGNRVPAADELAGLDIPEMGALAYPDFHLKAPEAV
jgi:ammonium transporter, Amt family